MTPMDALYDEIKKERAIYTALERIPVNILDFSVIRQVGAKRYGRVIMTGGIRPARENGRKYEYMR